MTRDTDAADALGDCGSAKAERELCENFGMTVKRVREFDPQTLDVTRACKFLGLPPKRYDLLATQPEARDRWVESVSLRQKVLIELFPEASRELKEMLEAIRKFATRKCLRPDSPAMLDGDGAGPSSKSQLETELRRLRVRTGLLVGGLAVTLLAVAAASVAVLAATRGRPEAQAVALAGSDAKRGLVVAGDVVPVAPAPPTSPPAASVKPAPVPVAPADPFAVYSVWSGDHDGQRRVLTVTGRLGESFTATFLVGDRIEREVQGRVRDGRVSWLAKDVRAVRGGVGVDNSGTIRVSPSADTIELNWADKDGKTSTYTLTKGGRVAPAKSGPKPNTPAGVMTPAQALKGKAGDAVTVQFGVASADLTPVKKLLLLNSEADHLDAKNFVVVLTPKARQARWKGATAATFRGQTVRAKGTLSLYEGKLQLLTDDEAAITLVK